MTYHDEDGSCKISMAELGAVCSGGPYGIATSIPTLALVTAFVTTCSATDPSPW